MKYSGSPTTLFGLEVPCNVRGALELDRKNGNHRWAEAIHKEMKGLNVAPLLILPLILVSLLHMIWHILVSQSVASSLYQGRKAGNSQLLSKFGF